MNAAPASQYSLEIRRTLRAPRDRVFRAWTELAALDHWMCRDVPSHQVRYLALDARPGGKYEIEVKDAGITYIGRGVFREVLPPEKLVFTWSWKKSPLLPNEPWDASESLVTVEFLDRGPSTEMRFRHELLLSEKSRKEHETGWLGCFKKLEEYLAG